ncbi:MAG: NADH-quinone oxidoreductase subunit NuoE [Anaerolineae bacterium]
MSMSNTAQVDDKVHTVVQQAINRYGREREGLIPVLSEVNRVLGYLSPEALSEISSQMRIPQSQVFSVASFYRMLSTKPRGRHVIQFCESAPCHVVGGREVWQVLQEELSLRPGETSPDGRWTLVTTSCLGVCAVGPVVIVDNDVYGNVDRAQLPQILARYE